MNYEIIFSDAFDELYRQISHPKEIIKKGLKVSVRVISQFGEETMKVMTVYSLNFKA